MTLQLVKAIIGTMRPPFLLLTVSVMSLSFMTAYYECYDESYVTHSLDMGLVLLVFLGALAAHVAVNMLNEYEDDASGLDAMTDKTPFSGGSGRLQACPEAAPWVEGIAWGLIGFVVVLGIYFTWLRGWEVIPIGVLGLLIVVFYTTKITQMPWLCLIAPGLAFGPFMVMGGFFVLTGYFSLLAFGVSLVPFFLVNNLLLLNQFPDFEADRIIGRYNLLMLVGQSSAVKWFLFFMVSAFLVILSLVALKIAPVTLLIGLLPFLLGWQIMLKMADNLQRPAETPEKIIPALGLNVAINLLTPLLMAVGLGWAMLGGIQ